MKPTLAYLSDDAISREGAEAYFRSCPRVRVVTPGRAAHASVLVMLAGEVTDAMLTDMETAARTSVHPDMRMVLVAESVSEAQLARAVRCGLVSVLLACHDVYVTAASSGTSQPRPPAPQTGYAACSPSSIPAWNASSDRAWTTPW